MNYRCPKCHHMLGVSKLFFSDISTCKDCGQKVVLGDAIAFFIAALSMLVLALTALYWFTQNVTHPVVAGGYSLAIGMVTGLIVLLLLGRAIPHKPIRLRRRQPPPAAAG